MSVCDKCTAGAGCCLDYLGAACKRYRDRECPDVQPTNADRIRAMSDEELAVLIRDMMDCVSCRQVIGCRDTCSGSYKECAVWCKQWLQQPAPEEGEQ